MYSALKRPADQPPKEKDFHPLRHCLGRFGTGVSAVTYVADDEASGITISSFTSVSLDPPLVMISVSRRARACAHIRDTPFAVNVLAADQAQLALHFGGRPQPGLDVPWAEETGVPRLEGTAAWLRCDPWRMYDGGDHVLFLGEVTDFAAASVVPLLHVDGGFRRPGPQIVVEPASESQ
ncbi:flavin reductase family protein [Streptomyces afghaniensis]|uniref:flavin reductase family protein n=1 Tax=Streptomyces afghaniensis TaxID=66865 RepID=UPI002786472F|nr:flavin reductase family protein [Streptomyces afghaniensis]MDQ1015488.1 flavin reductase (DIM6/NTAB) family NADH-FMN oxidoreductase RutF [Streptomyces afghaniensis]